MDITMLFLILVFSSIFLLLIFTHKKTPKPPPGPPGLPLIGHFHHLHNSSPHHHLWQLSKTYGPLMSVRLGVKPILVVSSAKMAKQILKTQDLAFASRPSLLGSKTLSYNGLDVGFTQYGEYFKEMKKLCILHFFGSRPTRSSRTIREAEVSRMVSKILSQSGASSKIINVSEACMHLTSDLICRIAFGKRYGEEEEFRGLLIEAQNLLVEFYFTDYVPWLGWVDGVRGLLGRLEEAFKKLDVFYEQVIEDHLDPIRRQSHHHQHHDEDIIDIFLGIMEAHSFPFDLTMDHIKALLMNIFLAGTDPSAATIVWAMTSLIKNPQVMKKAQEEIRSVYGEKDFINEEDIQKLPYLKAIVKETLRLFPPSPLLLPRESMQKCNIEGYEIQPKTLVFVNAWAIARDPMVWEEAEMFDPERFLKCSPADFKGQDFELIPFGAGRRMCPGMQLGLVTVELALANLLHSFDWKLAEGLQEKDIDTEMRPGITVHKKNDLCLVVHNHKKNKIEN